MDEPDRSGTFPASMKTAPLAVAFREVRHFRPDDWLHCEPIALRGEEFGWTIPAHRHEGLHQLQCLLRGKAVVTLDDVPHTVAAPAVLMIAPGCVHGFRYQRSTAGQQVTVPSARLEAAFGAAPALAALLRHTHIVQGHVLEGEAPRLAELCAGLAAEFEGNAAGRSEALQAHLVLFVTWLLRRAAPPSAAENQRALRDTLVARYRALIERHLRRHRPLGFYAAQLHITPDHLSRSCRSVSGLSALGLLHERMVVEARRLLAHTAAPVSDVASDLGFDDPAYFARFFARRAGHSPQAYRLALAMGRAALP